MSAEVALQNAAVGGAVEQRAPGFQFAHARRRFLGVQLGHARIVQILAAAHGVGEMDAPVVAIVHIAHGSRHAAFRHHGVGFAEQRFADHSDLDAARPTLRWPRAVRRHPRRSPTHHVRTFGIPRPSEDSPIRPDAHGAHPYVQIGEGDPEQAHPRKQHVAAIQAAHAVVHVLADRAGARAHRTFRPPDGGANGSRACSCRAG